MSRCHHAASIRPSTIDKNCSSSLSFCFEDQIVLTVPMKNNLANCNRVWFLTVRRYEPLRRPRSGFINAHTALYGQDSFSRTVSAIEYLLFCAKALAPRKLKLQLEEQVSSSLFFSISPDVCVSHDDVHIIRS